MGGDTVVEFSFVNLLHVIQTAFGMPRLAFTYRSTQLMSYAYILTFKLVVEIGKPFYQETLIAVMWSGLFGKFSVYF